MIIQSQTLINVMKRINRKCNQAKQEIQAQEPYDKPKRKVVHTKRKKIKKIETAKEIFTYIDVT